MSPDPEAPPSGPHLHELTEAQLQRQRELALHEVGADPSIGGDPALRLSRPFSLPSGGDYYPNLPQGTVTISPIRGEQEEMLAAMGESADEAVLYHVVEQLTHFGADFSFKKLLTEDFAALFLEILNLSYGKPLRLRPQCPQCRRYDDFEKKISEIQSVALQESGCWDAEKGKAVPEPFITDPLPLSGVTVEWRKLRVGDMLAVKQHVEQQRRARNVAGESAMLFIMARHFMAIDGNPVTVVEAHRWCAAAVARDLKSLRRAIEKRTFGPDLSPEVTCPFCKHEYKERIPLDPSFFRDDD